MKTSPAGCQSADARAVNHIESIASTLTRIYPHVSKPITVEGGWLIASPKPKTCAEPFGSAQGGLRRSVENLKRRLVEGLQVVTGEGVLSGSGHLSARLPGTETFLINPRFAGVLADPKDICTVNFEGKRIAGKGPIPSETPIHAAVYRSRSDVGSVIHCHARYSILVGLLDSGLIPFNREARIFADGVPIFPESRGINSFALAEHMVETLGQHYAVFLRGHGVVVAGPGIEGTCLSAIQLERACQDQLLMMSITTVKPMADAGRGRNNARLENPYRAWPFLLYKHKVKSKAQIRAGIRTLEEGEHY